jgi:hypothetical protein
LELPALEKGRSRDYYPQTLVTTVMAWGKCNKTMNLEVQDEYDYVGERISETWDLIKTGEDREVPTITK